MRSFGESTKERTKTMRIFPRLRIFVFVLNGAAILMTGQVREGQDRSQGRSMVISRNGIVAAQLPLAAQAGVKILDCGSNTVGVVVRNYPLLGVCVPL